MRDDQCPACGATPFVKYPNGKCVRCATREALAFAQSAHGLPMSRQAAIRSGSDVYVRVPACAAAGHVGLRTIRGVCWFCQAERVSTPSPRQQALAAGQKWYTPARPCTRCGTLAERYVANGRCRGCGGSGRQ
jgi:hypothetical protein